MSSKITRIIVIVLAWLIAISLVYLLILKLHILQQHIH